MIILEPGWPLYQYLWTLYFLIMAFAGFWSIFYLTSYILPIWLTAGLAEYFGWMNTSFDPEKVRYQRLYEKEGVEVIYRKSDSSRADEDLDIVPPYEGDK